jgi:hypothetical protein
MRAVTLCDKHHATAECPGAANCSPASSSSKPDPASSPPPDQPLPSILQVCSPLPLPEGLAQARHHAHGLQMPLDLHTGRALATELMTSSPKWNEACFIID